VTEKERTCVNKAMLSWCLADVIVSNGRMHVLAKHKEFYSCGTCSMDGSCHGGCCCGLQCYEVADMESARRKRDTETERQT
jgi:hypothetical protein